MIRLPSWLIDLLIAAGLAVIAVTIERATQGRLSTVSVLLSVGLGLFLLLRIGAILARAGRTLGCGFAFLVVWLVPCIGLGLLVGSSEVQRVMRDSLPLFLLIGVYLLVVMGLTFERVRVHDTARLEATPPAE
jgi:EamA domain-containing membrane protein RarD